MILTFTLNNTIRVKIKGGILITVRDIEILTGSSVSTARKEHRAIRDSLDILKGRLTIFHYCNYWGFEIENIAAYLNDNR